MPRPKLLFLTRSSPLFRGPGFALRAGALLEALSLDYEVYLLVVPVRGEASLPEIPTEVRDLCADALVFDPSQSVDPEYSSVADEYSRPLEFRFATSANVSACAQAFGATRFDAVHVFRLFLAPFAAPFLDPDFSQRPFCSLDMDDYQSHNRRVAVRLQRQMGEVKLARLQQGQADRFLRAEREWLPRFDCVYMACERERAQIAVDHPQARFFTLPNAVRLPPFTGTPCRNNAGKALMFVGSLGYPPNVDAVVFFCNQVLPRLRQTLKQPLRVVLAGAKPVEAVQRLARLQEIEVIGDPQDVAPLYAEADIAVVPLRGGSGTRIKILEAAAHHTPIVSTSVGADGLAVSDGRQLLLADDAEAFARAVYRLLRDPELADSLASCAFDWVRTEHSVARQRELLREARTACRAGLS